MPLKIIILAAGLSKRMHSKTPKILHVLGGKPVISHLMATIEKLPIENCLLVYGNHKEVLQEKITAKNYEITWVNQQEQRGTGDAVKYTLPYIAPEDEILILSGDVPLVSLDTLQRLLITNPQAGICLLTAHFREPFGLGRIIRDSKNTIVSIVEEKDATPEQQAIPEIYSGIMRIKGEILHQFLSQLTALNSQKEYYLTELIHLFLDAGGEVATVAAANEEEVSGINTRDQLAKAERFYQKLAAQKLMHNGVTLCDPARFDLRGDAEIAPDVTIDIDVILEGNVKIGTGSKIGPYCYLRDVTIGEYVTILPNSVIQESIIGDYCSVGPFVHLRPGTTLASSVKIGNFVEIKQSSLDEYSKVNHLSYIGDAAIGKEVNIGAGVITCNYDGVNKYQTIIEDHVFVGSDCQLVAPLKIGSHATIGAGTTVMKDVPSAHLTLNRKEQYTIEGWQRPKKQSKLHKE